MTLKSNFLSLSLSFLFLLLNNNNNKKIKLYESTVLNSELNNRTALSDQSGGPNLPRFTVIQKKRGRGERPLDVEKTRKVAGGGETRGSGEGEGEGEGEIAVLEERDGVRSDAFWFPIICN